MKEMDHLNADLVRQYGLRDWIIKYSDCKADPALVERWINIPSSAPSDHNDRESRHCWSRGDNRP
jgi:hypothetical protein